MAQKLQCYLKSTNKVVRKDLKVAAVWDIVFFP